MEERRRNNEEEEEKEEEEIFTNEDLPERHTPVPRDLDLPRYIPV